LLLAVIGAGAQLITVEEYPDLDEEGVATEDYYYDDVDEGSVDDVVVDEAPASTATPPKFDVEGTTHAVRLGEDATLPCTGADEDQVTLVEKSPLNNPNEVLILNMDAVFLIPNKEGRFSFANKTLTIKSAEKDDEGLYSCVYQYGSGKVQITHTLNVVYPPAMRKACAEPPCSTTQYHQEGETPKVQCGATGNPAPNISWTRMETGEAVGSGPSLTLPPFSAASAGRYLCTAHNGVGANASVIRELRLKSVPVVEAVQAVVRAGEGAATELQCRVRAEPAETSVTWQREGEQLQMGSNASTEGDAHIYRFSLPSVAAADLANYTCFAANDMGSASASFELTAAPSAPLVEADPKGAAETGFSLTWSVETYLPVESVEVSYRLEQFNDTVEEAGEWINITRTGEDIVELSAEGTLRTFKEDFENLEKDSKYEGFISVFNSVEKTTSDMFEFSTLAPATTTAAPTTTAATTQPPAQQKVTAKDGKSRKQASGALAPTLSGAALGLALAVLAAY